MKAPLNVKLGEFEVWFESWSVEFEWKKSQVGMAVWMQRDSREESYGIVDVEINTKVVAIRKNLYNNPRNFYSQSSPKN